MGCLGRENTIIIVEENVEIQVIYQGWYIQQKIIGNLKC